MVEQTKQNGVALTETPEFKAMVATAVAAELAKLPAAQLAALGGAGSAPDSAFAQSLALALAEFNEQGGGKKYVDPKILKTRRDANEKMWELIFDAHRDGKMAKYQLTGKVVLADELIEPFWLDTDHTAKPTTIDWTGAPNGSMIPLNDTAKAIFDQFKLSVGSTDNALESRPMGMTPGGLVVHGGAVPKRRGDAGRLPQHGENLTQQTMQEQGGLSVHHRNAAGQPKPQYILGTHFPPATEINSTQPGAR